MVLIKNLLSIREKNLYSKKLTVKKRPRSDGFGDVLAFSKKFQVRGALQPLYKSMLAAPSVQAECLTRSKFD